ncbi:MAG: hypothetical protein QM783_03545 [Phycisphaerales bacterium]
MGGLDDFDLRLIEGVERDHDDVAEVGGHETAAERAGGGADGADEPFVVKIAESGEGLGVEGVGGGRISLTAQDALVEVGRGGEVEEGDVEVVGAEAMEAAVDAGADGRGGEVVAAG